MDTEPSTTRQEEEPKPNVKKLGSSNSGLEAVLRRMLASASVMSSQGPFNGTVPVVVRLPP